jgi:hypothetical protein
LRGKLSGLILGDGGGSDTGYRSFAVPMNHLQNRLWQLPITSGEDRKYSDAQTNEILSFAYTEEEKEEELEMEGA